MLLSYSNKIISMINIEKSRQDLGQLFQAVEMEVQQLRQGCQKNSQLCESNIQNQENQKNMIAPNLEQNIKEIKLYSKKLIDFSQRSQKQVQIYKEQLHLTEQELENSFKKIKELRYQLKRMQEALESRQMQVNQLKAFNMIDVSFIPSIQIHNFQQQKLKQSTDHDSKEEIRYENSIELIEDLKKPQENCHQIAKIDKQPQSGNLYDILVRIQQMGIKQIKPREFHSDFCGDSKKEIQIQIKQKQMQIN